MKRTLYISLLFTSTFGISQTSTQSLEFNNTKALLSNDGSFFRDFQNVLPGYEIPKGSGIYSIYSMHMWMLGKDSIDVLHGSTGNYGDSTDYFPGPIDDYLTGYYSSNSMWKISRTEINNHIANINQSGYIIPETILKWPGNQNFHLGTGAKLAPFVDLNGNNIYEPGLGEYPLIKGDQAVYIIMNDKNGVHSTNAESIGMEVHAMAYQYASNDNLNNTTFINIKAFNRGTTNLNDFTFGLYTDFDLGRANDDYMGCDSTRNMMYVYNGDNNDDTTGSGYGYGANPPSVGVKFLSGEIGATRMFSNSTSIIQSDPSSGYGRYNCLNGLFANGQTMFNDGEHGEWAIGYPTKFQYSGNPNGNGWSEISAQNWFGDRRGLISFSPTTFNSGDQLCYDFAIIYSRANTNNLLQVNHLEVVADSIQTYFDGQQDYCSAFVLGLDDMQISGTSEELSVFPNPSSDIINIDFTTNQFVENSTLKLQNIMGQTVIEQSIVSLENNRLDISRLPKGIYLLVITCNNKTFTKSIVKY